jgi:hypothetical protein
VAWSSSPLACSRKSSPGPLFASTTPSCGDTARRKRQSVGKRRGPRRGCAGIESGCWRGGSIYAWVRACHSSRPHERYTRQAMLLVRDDTTLWNPQSAVAPRSDVFGSISDIHAIAQSHLATRGVRRAKLPVKPTLRCDSPLRLPCWKRRHLMPRQRVWKPAISRSFTAAVDRPSCRSNVAAG